MAKEEDVVNLLQRYEGEGKMEIIDALYLWARGWPSSYITRVLRTRYGDAKAYGTILSDLGSIGIESNTSKTEDTKVEVREIIIQMFESRWVMRFLEKVKERMKELSGGAIDLLTTLYRLGAFESEGYVKRDVLWGAYRALWGRNPIEFEKREMLDQLMECGIVEVVDSSGDVFPSPYAGVILSDIRARIEEAYKR